MINRISVNTLLKGVIAPLVAAVVAMLGYGAWSSWDKLRTADRMTAVAEASSHLFTALHNLRVDRSGTTRDLRSDRTFPQLSQLIVQSRSAEMPALSAALVTLGRTSIPDRAAVVSDLDARVKKLAAMQAESASLLAQAPAPRRAQLAQEYFNETSAMIDTLDKISSSLTRSVKLEDAFVDQLLQLKQLAWMARNAAGDVSLMLSNTLGGQALPADALLRYNVNMARLETSWAAVEDAASGLPLPAKFTDALKRAKTEFMGPDYSGERLKLLNALIAGQKPSVTADEWSRVAVSKLSSLLGVAEAALGVASDHAGAQKAAATQSLALSLGFLAVALVLAFGVILMVSRRVTGPLKEIQLAMQKVAVGDFDVALPGLNRKDEIGDMANAVERFKVLAVEKAHEEADQMMRRQTQEAERQAEIARAEAAARAQAADERARIEDEQRRREDEQRRQVEAERERAEEERRRSAEAQARSAEEQATAVRALADGLARLSEGDLTVRLDEGFTEAYRQIRDDFNATITRLQETIGAIAEATREATNAAGEISASTVDLSTRTEEQAASLEETSASMEEIAATVKKNAESAQHANQSAIGAHEVANRSGAVVANAVEAMSRIEESSRRIADIIGVIDEIARQTNLLALNAAVEAARAGEAGRGFAVVASEVRSLAQRSSQAAKDIKDLITSSSGQVKEGVDLVNKAGKSLAEIVGSIKSVAEIVSEIAVASSEQATAIEQVNKALSQMDEATQQNSALVEENAATAKTLEEQSGAMDQQVNFFRIDDGAAHAPAIRRAA